MAAQRYNIDPTHSSITFQARHLVVSKVNGQFGTWTGELSLDLDNLANSSVKVEVDVASLDTKVKDRDTHLRSADFFDVEKFPKATFKSTRFEKKDDVTWRIHGDLTIRDQTHPFVIEAEYNGQSTSPWGQKVVGFSASGELSRSKWGLGWNKTLETGGVLVSEKIKLGIELEASRAE